MIRKVAHIAIAVKSIEDALPFYTHALGMPLPRIEFLSQEGVKIAFLPIGGTEIELLEPVDPQGAVARFLERRGEGMHHICLEVDNLQAELASLAAKGVDLIDREPRQGAQGKVAFLHPRAANGVLVELIQGTQ